MDGWVNGWMDGRKDGWTEGGRQANCYYKETYYHKYFKCPAINHWVFMTWTTHKSNKAGFACSPVPRSIFSHI